MQQKLLENFILLTCTWCTSQHLAAAESTLQLLDLHNQNTPALWGTQNIKSERNQMAWGMIMILVYRDKEFCKGLSYESGCSELPKFVVMIWLQKLIEYGTMKTYRNG